MCDYRGRIARKLWDRTLMEARLAKKVREKQERMANGIEEKIEGGGAPADGEYKPEVRVRGSFIVFLMRLVLSLRLTR